MIEKIPEREKRGESDVSVDPIEGNEIIEGKEKIEVREGKKLKVIMRKTY